MTSNNPEIIVPFHGFYNSVWDLSEIDLEGEDDEGNTYEIEFDWTKSTVKIAENYIHQLNLRTIEHTPIRLTLEYVDLKSPKEYNFYTDTLKATINQDFVDHILNTLTLKSEFYEQVKVKVKELGTRTSGYIPYYSWSLTEWLSETLDAVQLGVLFECYIQFITEDPNWFDTVQIEVSEDKEHWLVY
jgi:hypothetical protein